METRGVAYIALTAAKLTRLHAVSADVILFNQSHECRYQPIPMSKCHFSASLSNLSLLSALHFIYRVQLFVSVAQH